MLSVDARASASEPPRALRAIGDARPAERREKRQVKSDKTKYNLMWVFTPKIVSSEAGQLEITTELQVESKKKRKSETATTV